MLSLPSLVVRFLQHSSTFTTGFITDDNTPTFNGTGIPGKTLYLYQYDSDGTLISIKGTGAGSTTVTNSITIGNDGKWTFTPEYLTNRTHKVFASYESDLVSREPNSYTLPPAFELTIQGITAAPKEIGLASRIWGTSVAGDINGDGFDDLVGLSYNGGFGDV